MATTGTSLGMVSDTDNSYIVVNIKEADINNIETGQKWILMLMHILIKYFQEQ